MQILTHALYIRMPDGEQLIDIRIFKPTKALSHSWSCKYEIDWPEGMHEAEGFGADALQALSITLKRIGAEIYTSTYHQEGRLRAYENEDGYGFPVPSSIRDMLIGADKLAYG